MAATPSTAAFAATGLTKLSLDECISLARSHYKPSLSPEWETYLAYIKVCPLQKTRTSKVAVVLVSVFIDDYTNANTTQKKWKQFPPPLLISSDRLVYDRIHHFHKYKMAGSMPKKLPPYAYKIDMRKNYPIPVCKYMTFLTIVNKICYDPPRQIVIN